jgi:hypothetical protein
MTIEQNTRQQSNVRYCSLGQTQLPALSYPPVSLFPASPRRLCFRHHGTRASDTTEPVIDSISYDSYWLKIKIPRGLVFYFRDLSQPGTDKRTSTSEKLERKFCHLIKSIQEQEQRDPSNNHHISNIKMASSMISTSTTPTNDIEQEPRSRAALRMSRRVLIKAGTSVVANDDGSPSLTRLGAIVEQIAELNNAGVEVIFVSSGAVGM